MAVLIQSIHDEHQSPASLRRSLRHLTGYALTKQVRRQADDLLLVEVVPGVAERGDLVELDVAGLELLPPR